MKHRVISACMLVLLMMPVLVRAESMEERLRTQLRSTTQQLQQVQSQQAQLTAAKNAAEAERDRLKSELSTLQSEAKSQRARAEKLENEKESVQQQAVEQVNSSREQAAKVQTALRLMENQSTALQGQTVSLKSQLSERNQQYQQCVTKNQQMYRAGRELLSAYEAFGSGDLLAIRQPFSGQARVEFDERAQDFGDRLYQSQAAAETGKRDVGTSANATPH